MIENIGEQKIEGLKVINQFEKEGNKKMRIIKIEENDRNKLTYDLCYME